jgi:hypothetical protein
MRAFHGEAFGYGSADAPGSAGDQGNTAREKFLVCHGIRRV